MKRLTIVDEAPTRTFNFEPLENATLYITSCAPVKTESGFWRKLVPNEPA